MINWKRIVFSKLLIDDTLSYGIVQPGQHVELDSVPILRVNNFSNGGLDIKDVKKVTREIESKYLRTRLIGGELLITVVGSVGKTAIVPDSLKGWNVARAVSVARIKKDNDINFIKYCFATEDIINQMYGVTNDTVQPTLNLKELKSLKLLLPPLPEQKAIASVLSSLDAKIDILHRQNKTLEQLAETIFRQWFVEEADEGWESVHLSEIAEVKNGFAFSSKTYVDHTPNCLEVFKMGHIERGGGLRANPKKDYAKRNEKLERYILNKDDIVMAMTDMKDNVVILGVPAMIDKSNHYALNQRVARIYLKNNEKLLSQYFLYIQLNDKDNIAILQSKANSGVQVNLSTQAIKDIEILIPPMQLQIEKGDSIISLYEKKNKNNNQIKTLEKLRDTLLPKLMSGEVRVEMD